MTYDVEVFTDKGGWATDMTVAGRQGKRRALDRAHELEPRVTVRVIDRHGRRVTQ